MLQPKKGAYESFLRHNRKSQRLEFQVNLEPFLVNRNFLQDCRSNSNQLTKIFRILVTNLVLWNKKLSKLYLYYIVIGVRIDLVR